MKKAIHPDYQEITVICSCGSAVQVYSTLSESQNVDTCFACHPQYTGKKRSLKASRVKSFREKYTANLTAKQASDTA